MLRSALQIKQAGDRVVNKIRDDYGVIQERFKDYMTLRMMRAGIEVLGDLLSFFESSPAFISVACEKLRKQHGPTFKLRTVEAILNLRSDLTREDRHDALEICRQVLKKYADGAYDEKLKAKQAGGIKADVFEELDDIGVVGGETNEKNAEAANLDESTERPQTVEVVDEEDADDAFADFLKEGHVDVEEMQNAEL